MKAAVVEKQGVLGVRDNLPDPKPGPYDALCQMLYGATCTGTDQHIIHNRFPWGVKYPTILGHESVGKVLSVGQKVRNLKVGDLVTRVGCPALPEASMNSQWGGFASKGIATDWRAMKDDGLEQAQWNGAMVNQVLPPDTDPRAATMIITWRETLSCSMRLGIGEGSKVLVIGTGGNGLSFAMHARNLGASVVAVAGSAARESAARAAGAAAFADYRDDAAAAKLKEAAPGGYDYLIDVVGKAGDANRYLSMLAKGGSLTVYGLDEFHSYSINPLYGNGDFRIRQVGYAEAESHDKVVEFLQAGKLDASVFLDLERPYDLDDIPQAFDAIASRKAIKALVKLS